MTKKFISHNSVKQYFCGLIHIQCKFKLFATSLSCDYVKKTQP